MPVSLAPQAFRYFVVEVTHEYTDNGINNGLILLQEASSILPIELDFPLTLYPGTGASYGGYQRLGQRQHELIMSPVSQIDPLFARTLTETATKICAIKEAYPELHQTISLLLQARKMVDHTALRILGVFAVLERLLTHNPDFGYDSLSHQIYAKLAVIDPLLHAPLDYSVFQESDPKKVWKHIYSYRSRIAHGTIPRFDQGALRMLNNAQTIDSFVQSVAKAILRMALDRPQFIADLKAC